MENQDEDMLSNENLNRCVNSDLDLPTLQRTFGMDVIVRLQYQVEKEFPISLVPKSYYTSEDDKGKSLNYSYFLRR
jgi:hypothetical protein